MTTASEQFWENDVDVYASENRAWHPFGYIGKDGLEAVDHINPQHYQTDSLEAIDVIEAFFMHSPHLANVFKYIARAGKKDDLVQDLEKAQWYLDRYINFVKENQN